MNGTVVGEKNVKAFSDTMDNLSNAVRMETGISDIELIEALGELLVNAASHMRRREAVTLAPSGLILP